MTRELAFLRPTSIAEACALLAEHGEGAKVVAGATALTIMLRKRLIDPAALVSIGAIPGLASGPRRRHPALGALATHRQVERDPLVRRVLPVVADTFGKVANVRVRNAATVGGVMAEADYASDPPAVFVGLDAWSWPRARGLRTHPGQRVLPGLLRDRAGAQRGGDRGGGAPARRPAPAPS